MAQNLKFVYALIMIIVLSSFLAESNWSKSYLHTILKFSCITHEHYLTFSY